jgi:hypothetical protein
MLMCTCCHRPTMHMFLGPRRAGEMGDYEHRYQCMTCQTERRYGLFNR